MDNNNDYDAILDQNPPQSPGGTPANDYDHLIASDKPMQREAMASAAYVAKDAIPDRHAQVLKLADQMSLPASIVDRNFEDLTKKQQVAGTDYDGIIDKTPEFASWLQKPDNAALAKDDHEALGNLESTVKEHTVLSQMYNALGSGIATVASQVAKVPALAYDVAAVPQNMIASALGYDDHQVKAPDWLKNNPISKHYDDNSKAFAAQAPALSESVVGHIKDGNYSKAGQALAVQMVNGAPQLAALVVGALTGVGEATAIGVGVTTAAGANSEVKENPGVTPLQSTGDALLKGTIATEFGRLGTLGVLSGWESAIAKNAGKQVSKEVMRDFAKTLIYSVGRGTAQGGGMSLANDFADFITGVNPDAMTGSVERAVNQGLVLGATEPFMAVPGLAGGAHERMQQVRQTEMSENFYKSMGASAEATKLRKRLPKAQRELVEQITRDTPVENLYISPQAAEVYFQKKGLNPVSVMNELGVLPEYGKAKEAGTDIKIPMSKWIDKVVGTEHYQGLEKDIKFSPEDLSVNELKTEHERLKSEHEAAQAAKPEPETTAEQSAAKVGDTVSQQLEAAGVHPTSSKIYEAGFHSLGERMGVDPQELFNQFKLKITGGEEAQAQHDAPLQTDEVRMDQPARAVTFPVKQSAEGIFSVAPGEGMNAAAHMKNGSMEINALYFHPKYMGVAQDMIRSLEKTAVGAGAYSMRAEVSNDKLLKAYKDQGFEVEGKNKNGDTVMVKDLSKLRTYNQDGQIAPPFYSKLQKTIEEKMGGSQDVKSLRAMLKDMKPEEMKWSGIDDFLKDKEKVSKTDLLDFLRANQLEIQEITHGDISQSQVIKSKEDTLVKYLQDYGHSEADAKDVALDVAQGLKSSSSFEQPSLQNAADELRHAFVTRESEGETGTATKFSKYTLPGGENYREVLFKLPPKSLDGFKMASEDHDISTWKNDQRASFRAVPRAEVEANPEFVKAKKALAKSIRAEHPEMKPKAVGSFIDSIMRGSFNGVDGVSGASEKLLAEIKKLHDLHKKIQYPHPKEDIYKKEINGERFMIVDTHTKDRGVYIADEQRNNKDAKYSNVKEALVGLEKYIQKTDEHKRADTYKSGHFDEANILAHTRLNDRVDADGKKTLFVEEVQSDWHQAGRKKGYKEGDSKSKIAELEKQIEAIPDNPNFRTWMDTNHPDVEGNQTKDGAYYKEWEALADAHYDKIKTLRDQIKTHESGVPDAPFKKTWHEFVMKRLIRMAAEQGYDKIAWTKGEQQADRYDLGKQVDTVQAHENKDGTFSLHIFKDGEIIQSHENLHTDKIEDVVGKDLALKISNKEGKPVGNSKSLNYSGADLKVGGEGMKGFYDKMLPDFANKFGKKFGAKVSETEVGERPTIKEENGKFVVIQPGDRVGTAFKTRAEAEADAAEGSIRGDHATVHSMEITPQLKDAALNEGFSLFQGGGDNPLGQIHIGKDGINISILKNADNSTFLHETGHFYLEVMSKLAGDEKAPDQIKEDFGKIREWLGAKEGESLTVDQHEQFARGFEAYLMEGKAPSEGLRKAFANFKVWLTNIYKKMRSLNVELSPEIRGVYDRILATDKEIQDAQTRQNYKPLFSEPAMYKLTPDDFAKYQSAIDAAKLAADDTLRAKVMKDITQTDTAIYKDQEAHVRGQIEEEANQTRVFKAKSLLQLDKMPDGTPRPEGSPKLKLDRESLVRAYGKEILEKLPRMYSREGGMDHNLVAEMLGYEDGDHLVQELVNSPTKQDYVEQQTKARMEDMHPDMLSSGQMPDEAMAAIHNEQQSKVLRMELEFLARNNMPELKGMIRKVAKRVPTDQEIRANAEKTIGASNVRELTPGQYKSAEARHAREAGEKLTSGDFDGAFESKRLELYNHELFKAVTEAKEEVDKAMKDFRKMAKKSDADLSKTRDTNLVATARAVLAAFGIGTVDKQPAEYLEKLKRYDPENYAAAHSLVEMATADGAGNFSDISYDKFISMRDTVKGIWDLAKSSQQITIDGKKMSKQVILDGLNARISDLSPTGPRPGYEKAMTTWEKTKITLMSWRAAGRRVESWVTAMDGAHQGLFRTAIWNPITEAATKFRLAKHEMMREYLDTIVKPVEDTFNQRVIDAPEINYQFKNKSQLLGALLHTGNESNFSKLLRGRNWGTADEQGNLDSSRWDKMIARMHKDGTLTKKDYDYVQGVWNLYEKTKVGAQKAHKDMYGYYFNEITAKKIETPFGEYAGGYAPAIADPTLSEDAQIRNDKEQIEKNNNSFMFPTTGRGFTKERVEAYAAPLAIDLEYVPMQIDKVLRFTHIEPSVKEVGRLINDKSFRQTLSGLDPVVASEMLTPWLQRAAQQQTSTPSQGKAWKGFDWVMRKARGNTGMNAMVGNLVNVLHQTTGLPIILTRVEASHFRDAMWGYLKDAKGTTEMMNEKSDYMRSKESNIAEIQSDINDIIMNPSKYDKTTNFIKQNGFILQRLTAGMVENVAWQSAYRQSTEKGMTEVESVRFADSVVRETQHSSNPEEISRFGTGSPFMRAFTMYFDYYNMKANLLGTEAGNIYREMGMVKGFPALSYLYATGFMLPAVMAASFYHLASGRLDENDDHKYMDDVLKIFFGGQLSDGLALVPVAGPIVNNFINRFNDNPMDDRISVSPVFKNLERVLGTPKELIDVVKHPNHKRSNAIHDSMSLLGMFTGLPIEPLSRPLGYLSDVQQGFAKPTGPIDFTRGLMTGQSGAPHKK